MSDTDGGQIILFPRPAPPPADDVVWRDTISDELAIIVTVQNELWLETPDRRVRIMQPSAIGTAIARARTVQRNRAAHRHTED